MNEQLTCDEIPILTNVNRKLSNRKNRRELQQFLIKREKLPQMELPTCHVKQCIINFLTLFKSIN